MPATPRRDVLTKLFKVPGFRRNYYHKKVYRDLVSQVIELRRAKQWTQDQLANEIGTYQSAISRIEAGEQNVTLKTINEIALALGCWVDLRLVEFGSFDILDEPVNFRSREDDQNTITMTLKRKQGVQQPVETW